MDTSKSYIRMCRNAKVIQEKWIPLQGDWCYVGARDMITTISQININGVKKWFDGNNVYELPKDNELYGIVWLPRADQIIDLISSIRKSNKKNQDNLFDFIELGFEENIDISIEKFCLMHYMASECNKFWRDGRWQKINNKLMKEGKNGFQL